MTRDEQEMALWAAEYAASKSTFAADRAAAADLAAAFFAHRYPPQPDAPEAIWYDEPPFEKDGKSYPCWVEGEEHPALVAMYVRWEYRANDDDGCWLPLAGRRVCPIVKPPEPPT